MILCYEANRDYQNNRQPRIIMASQKDKGNPAGFNKAYVQA